MHVYVKMPNNGYFTGEDFWFETLAEARQWIKDDIVPRWAEIIGPSDWITIRKDTDNDPRWEDDWCVIEDIDGADVGVYRQLYDPLDFPPKLMIPKLLFENSTGRLYDGYGGKEISYDELPEIQEMIGRPIRLPKVKKKNILKRRY